jgi:glycosyltransferase involved in cell wall biosynthesis
MTPPAAEVVQVLGRVRAGDPVTATVRAIHERLARLGRPGRVVTADSGDRSLPTSLDGALLVHTVDGGETLAPLVPVLAGRPLRLVHHGSAVGSDRSTLRALRGSTCGAVAADPAAREELRGLGYGLVGTLDPTLADGALDGIVPDEATAANLAGHPGPLLLSVGPVAPNRGVEMLIDAFAQLLTHAQPSAVLSLCGPAPQWYRARLHRHVITRGLLACEIVEPSDDGQVLARLERADAVISLRPAGLDPYVRAAARRGLPVVAPLAPATAGLASQGLVAVSPRAGATELAAALATALSRPRRAPTPSAGAPRVGDDADLLRMLRLA